MLEIPVVRWGKPYESLETSEVVHFETGETIARVGQSNGGLVTRDMRKAFKAREALKQFSCDELIAKLAAAADLFENETIGIYGGGTQSPDEFVHHQSASTGLPENMCRANMQKNCFVMRNMREILDLSLIHI